MKTIHLTLTYPTKSSKQVVRLAGIVLSFLSYTLLAGFSTSTDNKLEDVHNAMIKAMKKEGFQKLYDYHSDEIDKVVIEVKYSKKYTYHIMCISKQFAPLTGARNIKVGSWSNQQVWTCESTNNELNDYHISFISFRELSYTGKNRILPTWGSTPSEYYLTFYKRKK
ncbi:hypothetical protein GC194_13640 [bacterium]|nr:hypothetical protein [bacterium]